MERWMRKKKKRELGDREEGEVIFDAFHCLCVHSGG